MRLLLRRPFPAEDAREPHASWPTTLFVMLASGFVTWELLAEWHRGEEAFLALPRWAAAHTGLAPLAGVVSGLWALGIVPLVLWTGMAAISRVPGGRQPVGLAWRRLALPVAVVVSAGHMTKALAKFSSWVPFLPQAVRDPDGTATVLAITSHSLPEPHSLLTLPHAAIAGIVLVVTGFVLGMREARLAHRASAGELRVLLPKLALASGFLAILAGWAL